MEVNQNATGQTDKTNVEELLKAIDQQLLIKFLDSLVKEQLPEMADLGRTQAPQTGA